MSWGQIFLMRKLFTPLINTIDTDKNGEISREEFLTASDDFYNGVDETEVSRVFLGRLED